MTIRVFNTKTHKKEDFIPVNGNKVGIYACGPTVYDYFHIGNARIFIVFDVIRRYLSWRGYDVTFVQNFTDIDDKMINRAHELGITVKNWQNAISLPILRMLRLLVLNRQMYIHGLLNIFRRLLN